MPTKENWYTDEALLTQWIDDCEVRAALPAENYRTAMVDVAMDTNVTKPTGWYYTPNHTQIIVDVLQPAMVEAISGAKTVQEVVEENRAAMEAALGG